MSSEESEKVRKELLDLQKKRADLEQEILVYQDILKSVSRKFPYLMIISIKTIAACYNNKCLLFVPQCS